MSYQNELSALGLTPEQAIIYEFLMHKGISRATTISEMTDLKRGITYKILDQLTEMGLIKKIDREGAITLFAPEHPRKLEQTVEESKQKADQAQAALDGILGPLSSQFNLLKGKSNVQFYEGLEGIKKAAFNSLQSQTEILAYIDSETVDKRYGPINKEYVQRRLHKQIPKKILFPSTSYAQRDAEIISNPLTEVRILPNSSIFNVVMYIYDNTISYFSLEEDRQVAMIIEDPAIYEMHKTFFMQHWQQAKVVALPKQEEVGGPFLQDQSQNTPDQ
jgi:sugar-specific transcriptional regulator TrmB